MTKSGGKIVTSIHQFSECPSLNNSVIHAILIHYRPYNNGQTYGIILLLERIWHILKSF